MAAPVNVPEAPVYPLRWLSLRLLVEKMAFTFAEAALGVLVVSDALDATGWQTAGMAGIAAVLTFVMNAKVLTPVGLTWLEDTVWRTLRTGGATFLSVYLSMPVFTLDREYAHAALAAAVAAGLAVVKSAVAARVANPADGNFVQTPEVRRV